ncbi:MAG: hypothetical protein KDK39_14855 [Leptospiraceae bacterium]|nr:hypothetical protein [Leptospiraceae bacterium]
MQWFKDMQGYVNPLGERMYKLVLKLQHLGPVLDRQVIAKSAILEALSIASRPGTIFCKGTVLTNPDERLYQLGYPRITFLSEFGIRRNSAYHIDLQMTKFRLTSSVDESVDFMRVASRFIPGIKGYFIKELCTAKPALFEAVENEDSIRMDLSFFIQFVPSLVSASLSETRVVSAHIARENEVHLYIQTSLVLFKLVDYFGPEYLAIDEVNDQDAIELLWLKEE